MLSAEEFDALLNAVLNNEITDGVISLSDGLNYLQLSLLKDALSENKQIDTFKISKLYLRTPDYVDAFSGPFYSNIRELKLTHTGIANEAVKALAEALLNSPIEILCISHGCIGNDGAKFIARLLSKKHLITIDLSYNKIGPKGIKCIASSIGPNTIKVKLSHNPIRDEGITTLVELALRNKKITTLYLSEVGITNSGIAKLAELLRFNDHIASIYISGRGITQYGANIFKEALKQNTCVTRIKFIYTNRIKNKKEAVDLLNNDIELETIIDNNNKFLEEAISLLKNDKKSLTRKHIITLKAHFDNKLFNSQEAENGDIEVLSELENIYRNVFSQFFSAKLNIVYDTAHYLAPYLDPKSWYNFLEIFSYIPDSKKEFDQLLAPQGLHTIDVEGDGNCFFRALAYLMNMDHEELRDIAIDYMLNHPEQFEGFSEEGLDSYIDNMSKINTWADNLVIQALADNLEISLRIHLINGNIIRVNPENQRVLNIAYTGNHYLAIEEISQELATSDIATEENETIFTDSSLLPHQFLGESIFH